jgi:anti-sigma B factor antagonist
MLTDEGVLGAIGEQLDDLADTTHADMLLDFRGVRYMSSGMLAVLMPLQRKLARSGSALKLCNLDRALQEVFRVTALHRVLPIYGDAQTALDAFGRSRR